MNKEVIILAGGLGTRLQSHVPGIPKCLAQINSIPFIDYLIKDLINKGINRVILSVGHQKEKIKDYIALQDYSIDILYAEEEEQLGTGGAIQYALQYTRQEHVIILNGDTYFNIDLDMLYNLHNGSKADISIALKKMDNAARYGIVELDIDNNIIAFHEKTAGASGNINGGVYYLNKKSFLKYDLPKVFSFEKDFLETHLAKITAKGMPTDGYFIDIGIPADYEKAQLDFKKITF